APVTKQQGHSRSVRACSRHGSGILSGELLPTPAADERWSSSCSTSSSISRDLEYAVSGIAVSLCIAASRQSCAVDLVMPTETARSTDRRVTDGLYCSSKRLGGSLGRAFGFRGSVA